MKMINFSLKYISLLTLCIQNSALVIVMRYSRIDENKDSLYFTSTAVFLSELTKLIISVYIAIQNRIKTTGHFNPQEFYNEVFAQDAWKLAIPAVLYTIQNNLQYIAVGLLDAASFQVTYQLKILTTALCSVIMLKASLSGVKWFSLGLLTFGVTLVQLKTDDGRDDHVVTREQPIMIERIFGLITVFVACIISGIAGVYFEKVLKGSKTSLWIRNVQLSFYSLFPALIIGVWWKDGEGVWEKGFFHGYNMAVIGAIACQAVGGIIVAMVVKYADNILKSFATSVSIIISFLASVVLFDFVVTSRFLIGAILVLIATYIYGRPEKQKQKHSTIINKRNQNFSSLSLTSPKPNNNLSINSPTKSSQLPSFVATSSFPVNSDNNDIKVKHDNKNGSDNSKYYNYINGKRSNIEDFTSITISLHGNNYASTKLIYSK